MKICGCICMYNSKVIGINQEKEIYVNEYFSFCFVTFLKLNMVQFSHITENYFSRRQALSSFPTWLPQVCRKC